MISAPRNLVEFLQKRWPVVESSDPRIEALASLQRGRARRDRMIQKHGVPIPSTLIVSVTSACNLSCPTCGVPIKCQQMKPELSPKRFHSVLRDCGEFGIGHIVVVGGEPLLRTDLEDLIEDRSDLMFSIFTNGRLLTANRAARFASINNAILWLNLGSVSHERPLSSLPSGAKRAMELMSEYGIFKSYTVTLTQNNVELFSKGETLELLSQRGANFALFFDVLAELGQHRSSLSLNRDARERFATIVHKFFNERLGFAAVLPSDEKLFGGCGAAGRNFIHLSPTGSFEPCPFVPWSTSPALHESLLDAISSPYFRELREASSDWLLGGEDPCSYRAHSHDFIAICNKHKASPRE